MEGKGAGTIQDVTISQAKPPYTPPEVVKSSPELKRLESKKTTIEQAIYRNSNAQKFLDKYLVSLSSQQTPPSANLAEIIGDYDASLANLQKKMNELGEQLEEVKLEITAEESRIKEATRPPKKTWNANLPVNVAVGIFADVDGDVELGLIYGA